MHLFLKIILASIILFPSFTGIEKNQDIRQGKDYALFFAVDQYEEWQDLRYPNSDANAIAKELKQNYGFQIEVVKNPTQIQIYKKLEEYRKRSYAKDAQLLVFFTGHGTFTETQEGFFIPTDGKKDDFIQSTYIPHARLNRIVNAIPCQHILLGLDACFSGTFDEAIALNKGDERPGASKSQRQKFIDRTLQYKSRIFLTSGGKERTPDRSQFAQQFLAALRSFGGSDQIVSVNELIAFLESAQPTPRNGQFGNHEVGGNFLFVVNNQIETNSKPVSNQRKMDMSTWDKAERLNTISAYQSYLDKYPNGLFKAKAKDKIDHLNDETEWQIANKLDTKKAYENYLKSSSNPSHWKRAEELIQIFATAEQVQKNNPETKSFFNSFLATAKGEYYVTDTRDDQVYGVLQMKDGKKWMTKNLNYAIAGSFCYNNNPKVCEKYGRLYTWEAAMKACPRGWHLPSDEDWENMLSKYENAPDNTLMKGGNSEFSALLGGFHNAKNPNLEFSGLNRSGYYWSASEVKTIGNSAWVFIFTEDVKKGSTTGVHKNVAISCRCVKD